MKPIVKKVLLGVAGVFGLGALGAGGFVYTQVSAFDASMDKVYPVAPLPLTASTDPVVIARGKHVAESIGGCALAECHGKDLAGGKSIVMGPLATLTAPNITSKGLGAVYADGELARLVRKGIKKDGRSLRFMPSHEHNWLPEADLVAVVSYVRSMPGVDKPNGPIKIGTLGKVLDRQDKGVVMDVARKIEKMPVDIAQAATPTPEFGKYISRMCTGCHGDTLSGGPIPGAPGDTPVPLNLTPHETGMKGWSFEDWNKAIDTGTRKDGKPINAFMPIEMLRNMDETERKALFLYLQSVTPKPFGGR